MFRMFYRFLWGEIGRSPPHYALTFFPSTPPPPLLSLQSPHEDLPERDVLSIELSPTGVSDIYDYFLPKIWNLPIDRIIVEDTNWPLTGFGATFGTSHCLTSYDMRFMLSYVNRFSVVPFSPPCLPSSLPSLLPPAHLSCFFFSS